MKRDCGTTGLGKLTPKRHRARTTPASLSLGHPSLDKEGSYAAKLPSLSKEGWHPRSG